MIPTNLKSWAAAKQNKRLLGKSLQAQQKQSVLITLSINTDCLFVTSLITKIVFRVLSFGQQPEHPLQLPAEHPEELLAPLLLPDLAYRKPVMR